MSHVAGVQLTEYLSTHPDSAVRFLCAGCQTSLDIPIDKVIARLETLGLGDGTTDIRAAARCAERPCHVCGAMQWETRLTDHPRRTFIS